MAVEHSKIHSQKIKKYQHTQKVEESNKNLISKIFTHGGINYIKTKFTRTCVIYVVTCYRHIQTACKNHVENAHRIF